jgi:hypothetical protein
MPTPGDGGLSDSEGSSSEGLRRQLEALGEQLDALARQVEEMKREQGRRGVTAFCLSVLFFLLELLTGFLR